MPVDKEKVNRVIGETTQTLLAHGLTGEEYLLILQTLVAHVLAANNLSVKTIWLKNLNLDVRARRVAQLSMKQVQ